MSTNPPAERRLEVLRDLDILDSPTDPLFDGLAHFAASICHVPIAIISFIDDRRQWFKARIGLDLQQIDLTHSFCSHTLMEPDGMVVNDLQQDQRFQSNIFVVGKPYLRFYAGVPLRTREGIAVGTVAVMDRRPRTGRASCLQVLKMVAEQAMLQVELEQQGRELRRNLREKAVGYARLMRQASHLQEAQRVARLGSWEMDLSTRNLQLSEQVLWIFGQPIQHRRSSFAEFLRAVHDDDRQMLREAVDTAMSGFERLDCRHRIVRPGGAVRHVHQRGKLQTRPDGRAVFSGTVQDVTQQHLAEERRELLDTCIARVNDIIMITDADAINEPGPRIVFVNRTFEERTGYRIDEVLGRSPRFLQGPRTDRNALDKIRTALQRHEHVSVELINYRKDGSEFWVEMDIAPVARSGKKITQFVSVQRDITQRKLAEKQIESLAFFDPLTGLPNRRLLQDRLVTGLETAKRQQRCAALLFLDLDNFKNLNDTLGHDQGDVLLVQVAQRLQHAMRKSNTVARLGGDEFVILVEDLSREYMHAVSQIEIIAEKILDCFNQPFHIGPHEYFCTTSIGIGMLTDPGVTVEELMKRADLALYEAKAAGRNMIRFFDPRMQEQIERRVIRDREFRAGLEESNFVLHYQRQANDKDELTGAEALVRWRHPRLGLLLPGEFIPMAEESGLIVRLGNWVVHAACLQLASWEQSVKNAPPLAINISVQQFQHPDFLRQTLATFEQTGVSPSCVKFEITESALLNGFDDAVIKMTQLKDIGVTFSLDDFGTGYSSLSYLKKLPLDELKIDQSFIRDILTNDSDAAIARAIIQLGANLGLKVVAEGIESEGQKIFLSENGCHFYQGYWIGRPTPTLVM